MINLRKGVSTGSAKTTGFKATVWATLLAVCAIHIVSLMYADASQFAFYGIDIHDALMEASGGDTLALRTKARYYKRVIFHMQADMQIGTSYL